MKKIVSFLLMGSGCLILFRSVLSFNRQGGSDLSTLVGAWGFVAALVLGLVLSAAGISLFMGLLEHKRTHPRWVSADGRMRGYRVIHGPDD